MYANLVVLITQDKYFMATVTLELRKRDFV